MKQYLRPSVFVMLAAIAATASAQTPLGTDFTYQGQLKASGLPAIGTADLEFKLFNADAGGAQVGSTLSRPNVGFVNGLFTLSLDFGAGAFNGEARWLEVAVRSPAGAGNFTTLIPRQPLSATPYALQTRGITVDSTGRVGIGTTSPGSVITTSKLDVAGGNVVVSNNFGFLSLNATGTGIGAGIDTGMIDDLRLIAGGEQRVKIAVNGRVEIGALSDLTGAIAGVHIHNETDPFGGTLALEGSTYAFLTLFPHGTAFGSRGALGFLSPGSSDLTIANVGGGRIVLQDSGGTHLPTCGEESLRIVRGSVIENGPDLGTGFSATDGPIGDGDHIINFASPFSATPTVTVTTHIDLDVLYAAIKEVDSTHVRIWIHDTEFTLPGSFDFIAIGPR